MDDPSTQYRTIRLRLTELVRDLDDERLEADVPACPGWRIRDVVAHLVGLATDIATGNMADADASAHVERRAARPFHEVLHEWDDAGAVLEKLLEVAPTDLAARAVADLTSHELAIRASMAR